MINHNRPSFRQLINWKLFFVLWGAALVSVAALFPYLLALQKDALAHIPLPLPLLLVLTLAQNGIIFALVIFGGLWFAKQVGLGLPLLEQVLQKQIPSRTWWPRLVVSLVLGLATGVVIAILDRWFHHLGVTLSLGRESHLVWQGLLASFYGGIGEELLMRLGLMSCFIWLFVKVFHPRDNRAVIWLSIFITALLFGLGHLPVTASLLTLTPLVIIRALVLNGLGGLVFGWLFWKQGLEAAMVAHFSADIILHVFAPLLG